MADEQQPQPQPRTEAHGTYPQSEAMTIEVVGRFADRESFRGAVKALLKAGFERADLSVLDTHESLSAANSPSEVWSEAMAGLIDEVNYVGPITAAGLIAIASGPVGALVSGAVGAGLAGYALADLLSDIRATPHTEAFARALKAGAVLLWVRAETPERQDEAARILERHGGADIHTHERYHVAEGAGSEAGA